MAPGLVTPKPQVAFGRKPTVFKAAKHVLICVRRAMRAEVLHALKKTGRGGQKKPRRNQYSNVRCK